MQSHRLRKCSCACLKLYRMYQDKNRKMDDVRRNRRCRLFRSLKGWSQVILNKEDIQRLSHFHCWSHPVSQALIVFIGPVLILLELVSRQVCTVITRTLNLVYGEKNKLHRHSLIKNQTIFWGSRSGGVAVSEPCLRPRRCPLECPDLSCPGYWWPLTPVMNAEGLLDGCLWWEQPPLSYIIWAACGSRQKSSCSCSSKSLSSLPGTTWFVVRNDLKKWKMDAWSITRSAVWDETWQECFKTSPWVTVAVLYDQNWRGCFNVTHLI